MSSSRIARSIYAALRAPIGLGLCLAATHLSTSDTAWAGSCHPGSLAPSGNCECPAGFKADGPQGDQRCKPSGPPPGPLPAAVPNDAKLPADATAVIPIKGAMFLMGDGVATGAAPIRQVTVSDFSIDKYEVPVAEYKKCVDANQCSAPPITFTAVNFRCNWDTKRTAHPMNCVTWQEAQNFCLWKGKRLPTEAEWEYAARGKTSNVYPWGIDAPTCKHANFTEKSGAVAPGCGDGTTPIGTKGLGKSPFNLQDMVGNVEEWTNDWYGKFKPSPATNPGGPMTSSQRVVKGSAYDLSSATDQLPARREGLAPGNREVWLGFRCANGPSTNATPQYYEPATATPPPTPGPGPAPAPGPTGTYPPNDLGTMIKIPGGTFTMGSSQTVDSTPEHPVTLSSYFMDKYEVTVGEYRKCVQSNNCLTPLNSLHANCSYDKAGKDYHPVNCVEWNDAKKYCAWAGKRLPTEAEWEFAAKGTDNRTFPWGNAAPTCSHADFKSDSGTFCSGSGTSPVGKHPLGISYWGLHDMGGNIEEWVYDYWGKFASGALVNPSGPITGKDHVVRGGNWEIEAKYMKSFDRYHYEAAKYWLGFRCAKTGY